MTTTSNTSLTPQPVQDLDAIEVQAQVVEQPAAAVAASTALVPQSAAAAVAVKPQLTGAAAEYADFFDQMAEADLDLGDANALNGGDAAADVLGPGVPILVIQQKPRRAEGLEAGMFTNRLTKEQFDKFRCIILAWKFQRMYRGKFVEGAKEQEPVRCWSLAGRVATDGTVCQAKHWTGKHKCGDDRDRDKCEFNVWGKDAQTGKNYKPCADYLLLLLAVARDDAEEYAELVVFPAHGTSVKPIKNLLATRTALALRYGNFIPAELAALRPLTVGVNLELEVFDNYSVPKFSTYAVGKETFRKVSGLLPAVKKFTSDIHVTRLPENLREEGDGGGEGDGEGQGGGGTPYVPPQPAGATPQPAAPPAQGSLVQPLGSEF